jgi:ribonucleoside-triphosphate reductase
LLKFRDKYGIIPNVSDRLYFTNSVHCPVWKKMDPIQKIDIESELTGYSSGGCITYVELDASVCHNIDALETIVNYAMSKDIPYFAVNVPNDQCQDCGYIGEINDKCDCCGSTRIKRLRRVTGYLNGEFTEAFNAGKLAEEHDRAKHK